MSVASMTEIAFQSRKDVGTSTYFPRTYTELAAAAGGKETAEGDVNAAIRALTTYIPTEVLTLYIAVIAALSGNGGTTATSDVTSRWIAFYAFLVATPVVVWVVFMTKVKTAKKPIGWSPLKWPLWEMVAGTIAYVAWAFAIPGTPFAQFSGSWYSAAVAGVVVLVASSALGLVAPLFARPLDP